MGIMVRSVKPRRKLHPAFQDGVAFNPMEVISFLYCNKNNPLQPKRHYLIHTITVEEMLLQQLSKDKAKISSVFIRLVLFIIIFEGLVSVLNNKSTVQKKSPP